MLKFVLYGKTNWQRDYMKILWQIVLITRHTNAKINMYGAKIMFWQLIYIKRINIDNYGFINTTFKNEDHASV